VRTIVIVGAGIGGLTLALALARRGFPSTVLEQTDQLEQSGAGIQLSPNATRILFDLGLGDALQPHAVVPGLVRVMSATGREITRVPLGAVAEARYGAPYWVLHRGDLQTELLGAVCAAPEITLRLGMRAEDYFMHQDGVALRCRAGSQVTAVRGMALVGADGLWSTTRTQVAGEHRPRFGRRSAWRALVPVDSVPAEFRAPAVHLWLGRHAHLVHYPVKAGAMINIVAIAGDTWQGTGWSKPGRRDDVLARFRKSEWAASARALLEVPEHWRKWALYDRRPLRSAGNGAVTLLGDAAHPVLPFLAQGAALAIEDAAVLADALAATPNDPAAAMRRYESSRFARARQVQRAARRNGVVYHLWGIPAFARNCVMQALGGEGLLKRYDWLYGWTPAEAALE
jgi:salicylate hydroxylase